MVYADDLQNISVFCWTETCTTNYAVRSCDMVEEKL